MVRIGRIAALSALAAIALAGCNKIDLLEQVKSLHQQATIVAPPRFSVPEGTYSNDFTITMSCDTSGVSFRYTVDGSVPRADYGTQYAGAPIAIGGTVTIMAVAYRPSDQQTSPVTAVAYTMRAATPTQEENPVGIPARVHPASTNVTITLMSDTSGASMRYTTDGSTPSALDGNPYTGPFVINTTQLISAVAYRSGYQTSDVAEETYSIGNAANPTISPSGGTFYNDQTVTLSCGTSGATIYYTTNGAAPDDSSTQYTDPFTINSPATVKAVAYAPPLLPSNVVTSAAFVMRSADPSFDPGAGSYTTTQSVTITCATLGASIRYTTDGTTTPSDTVGTLYSGPVSITTTTTLKAIAYRSGWTNSNVETAVYKYPCGTPSYNPAAGTHNNDVSVTISTTTAGATIRYTTDGTTTPSSTIGTVYSTAISITTTTTLKAIAYKTGWDNSAVASGIYTVQAATPSVSPNGATASSAQSVTLTTATTGASMRLTTDGSAPSSTNGILYSGSFTLAGCTTLRAIAYKTGYSNSTVRSAVFHIVTPIDNTGTSTPDSALAARGSLVYVAYGDTTDDIVNVSRSNDAGDTWTHGGRTAFKTTSTDIYEDTSGVHLLFHATDENDFVHALAPAGTTYTVYPVMSNTAAGATAITAADDILYEAHYSDTDLYFSYSKDNGVTWTGLVRIDATGDVGVNPSISAYTKFIFISYYDVTNTSLKVAKSVDGGKTWSLQTVNNAASVGLYSDVYTADGTAVSIVYSDATYGDLKLARSSNGGSTWTITTIDSTGTSADPVGGYLSGVAGAPGIAYVSYADYLNNCVKIAKTTDYGNTWTLFKVTASGGHVSWTSIGLSGSVVCVSYYSPTTLWFAKSLDGGATW